MAVDGIPAERLSGIAAELGFAVRAFDAAARAPDVLVVGCPIDEHINGKLIWPCRGLIEYHEDDRRLSQHLAAAFGTTGLYIALTTATAFDKIDAARMVCGVLALRGVLPLHVRATVEMALHETIANALLHGNLDVDTSLKDDADQYEAFCDHLKSLLEADEARNRWLAVTVSWTEGSLDIAVDDEGEGYEPDAVSDSGEEATHGRGLAIVDALASRVIVDNGGRRTRLQFDY